MSESKAPTGIYIASKTKYAENWRGWRTRGLPIVSTWIDEAGPGESADLADLWLRCIREASSCDLLVCYRAPDDVLKGAFIELGAALASGREVWAVGLDEYTVANHPSIRHITTLDDLRQSLFWRFGEQGRGFEAVHDLKALTQEPR